jgi:hypothetical protein
MIKILSFKNFSENQMRILDVDFELKIEKRWRGKSANSGTKN